MPIKEFISCGTLLGNSSGQEANTIDLIRQLQKLHQLRRTLETAFSKSAGSRLDRAQNSSTKIRGSVVSESETHLL
jgi:hypothetical protein